MPVRLLLIAAFASSLVGACSRAPKSAAPDASAAVAAQPVFVTEAWKTLKDDRIGLEVRYPPTWTTATTLRGADKIPFALLDAPKEEFAGAKAGITFVATSTERSLKACTLLKGPRKQVGGVDFYGTEFQGGAANGAFFQRNMHALHDGYCYEIAIYAANLASSGHPTLKDESIDRFNATSDSILGTFKFVPRAAPTADAGSPVP